MRMLKSDKESLVNQLEAILKFNMMTLPQPFGNDLREIVAGVNALHPPEDIEFYKQIEAHPNIEFSRASHTTIQLENPDGDNDRKMRLDCPYAYRQESEMYMRFSDTIVSTTHPMYNDLLTTFLAGEDLRKRLRNAKWAIEKVLDICNTAGQLQLVMPVAFNLVNPKYKLAVSNSKRKSVLPKFMRDTDYDEQAAKLRADVIETNKLLATGMLLRPPEALTDRYYNFKYIGLTV